MNKPLCIYHGNCADGFGAAWAVGHALGFENVDFHPGVYQDPPPDVTGRDVIMVDFSYKYDVLVKILDSCKGLTILDHHKSAVEEVNRLQQYYDMTMGSSKLFVVMDMNRSGAMIAWDQFNPHKEPPQLLKHIQDRDLWKFELPGTREIQAALFSYSYDFDVWDSLMRTNLNELFMEGEAIERKHFKDIKELVAVCQRRMVIGGYSVPVASLPYTLTSDAGHQMASDGEVFAACYWDTESGRVFSLRSADHDKALDVSVIAQQYGGGGHAKAAGFRVPRDHELAKA